MLPPLLAVALAAGSAAGAPAHGSAAPEGAPVDAVKDTGVRNIDMPMLPDRVYEALQTGRNVSGAPPVRTD